MPKRTDIETILLIGSGPIVIGQACEFDYSGTQACRALREEERTASSDAGGPGSLTGDTASVASAGGDDGDDEPFVIDDPSPFSSRYLAGLKKLFATLRTIRDPEMALVHQVEEVIDYYRPIFEKEYYEDYPKREPDLDHFVGLAEGYESRQTFLAELALDPIELTAIDQEEAEDDEPPLILSTIHSAKGLEFHTVFLIRALEGNLPSRYALREEGGVDEELRLFYVAVTRAEQNLFISYPTTQYRRYRGEYMTDPSRFVGGIPEDVLEPIQLVEEDAAANQLDEHEEPKALSDGAGDASADEEPAPEDAAPGSDPASWDAEDELDDALPF